MVRGNGARGCEGRENNHQMLDGGCCDENRDELLTQLHDKRNLV